MHRPLVIAQVAASVDGRISIGPNRTMWEDLDDERLRTTMGGNTWSGVDAIIRAMHSPGAELLGSASLVSEGEPLTDLPPTTKPQQTLYRDYLPESIIQRPGQKGWLVVVDGRGRLRSGFKESQDNPGWHMLHLVSAGVTSDYLGFLQDRQIPYLIAGEKRVNLEEALGKLHRKVGVKSMISTAGGRLNGALMRAGLLDEINIIVHPVVIGGDKTPALFDGPDLEPDEWPASLELLSAQVQADGTLWLRYGVRQNHIPETRPGRQS